jgi:rieske iron-sulfur protein
MDDRRKFLQAIALAMLAMPSAQTASADDENPANEMRPQTGDLFVSEDDEKKIISPNDLWLNQQPLEAFPYDPKNKIVRDGSRLNRVLLVKLDLKTLGETTRERATPDEIVAYSGICTHQGCPVTGWINDQGTQVMKCFCHNSEYDPAHGAQVVFGPAPILEWQRSNANVEWPVRHPIRNVSYILNFQRNASPRMRSTKRSDRCRQDAECREHRCDNAHMRVLERTNIASDVDDLIDGGERFLGLAMEHPSLRGRHESPPLPEK